MSKKTLSSNLISSITKTTIEWLGLRVENPRTFGPPGTLGALIVELVAREFTSARREAFRDGLSLGMDVTNAPTDINLLASYIEDKVNEYESVAAVDRGNEGSDKQIRKVGVREPNLDALPLFEYRGDPGDFESF